MADRVNPGEGGSEIFSSIKRIFSTSYAKVMPVLIFFHLLLEKKSKCVFQNFPNK